MDEIRPEKETEKQDAWRKERGKRKRASKDQQEQPKQDAMATKGNEPKKRGRKQKKQKDDNTITLTQTFPRLKEKELKAKEVAEEERQEEGLQEGVAAEEEQLLNDQSSGKIIPGHPLLLTQTLEAEHLFNVTRLRHPNFTERYK